jgi:hypothetical protein
MTPRTLVLPLIVLGAASSATAADPQAPAKDRSVQRVERTADGRIVVRGAETGRMQGPWVINVDLRDVPQTPEWQPGDAIKEIPRRSYPPPGFTEPRVPDTPPDRLLARQPDPPEPYTMDFDVPLFSIDAQNFTGVTPPDTVGDVGPDHYIHAVNTSGGSSIRIYDKSIPPVALTTFVLDTLPGVPSPCNSGLGDPVVLYDPLADRWLLSEFSSSGNRLCVYISQTPNPVTGGWFVYQFQAPGFPDYPKYAVWPDAYYVTSNEGNSPPTYALDRVNMIAGLVPRPFQRFTAAPGLAFPFEALTPADLDGSDAPPAGAPGIVMRHRDDEVTTPSTGNDFLDMWEFHVDFNTPANSTFTQLPSIAVSDFSSELCGISSFNCFPQPGVGTTLDPLREVIMFRLQYRNFGTHQALIGNFVTDADGEGGGDPLERGGIRWFELRKTASTWSLFQEGTYSPDVNPRWMGGISMDGDGNIAVGYNVSSGTVFPSLRYAGRLAGDPAGTLGAESVLVAGTASNSSNRYGDYANMSVDPADDCTFWFTGEYNPLSQWRTRLGAFKFDSCGNAIPANNAVFDPALQAPSCAAPGRSCDSAATLVGRDTITNGAEPNQPNTIADSCADGTKGRFHVRESVDRIKVQTLDASQMSPGKVVRVDVTVWGFSPGFSDTLDLYRADNAASPNWVLVGSVKSGKIGQHVISMTYTLPSGAVQAVRARYRYRGERVPCGAGDFTDHDDLVFAVQ